MTAGKPIIGLAGGIGSGKSTVASILSDLGAAIIDSDRLNHEELNSPEVVEAITRWWGRGVITSDGRADRDAIRELVSTAPKELERLERLVHPRIARRHQELVAGFQADPQVRAIAFDTPLLFEVGLADECDCVVFVEADRDERCRRVLRSRDWTANDLERFEKSQMSLDSKRNRADYKVVNNSDIRDLREQVKDVFSRILAGK